MNSTRRAWRYVFARSDIPADSPFGLDDTRMRWTALMLTAPLVAFALVFSASVAFVPSNPVTNIVTVVVCIVAMVATLLAVSYYAFQKVPLKFAARRAAIAAPARQAGWTYTDELALPSAQTLEAVFHYARDRLVPETFTEVTTGQFEGHTFAAGHITGRERDEGGETVRGAAKSENIVLVSLPAPLPELKLRDRSTSIIRDYGWSMAVISTGDPAFDRRWEVQTNYAEFARELFSPELRSFLAEAPLVPCTIVIRNGYIIASRDPEATFSSVTTRLQILTGVIERVQPALWTRGTTPQEAGFALRTNYRKAMAGPVL